MITKAKTPAAEYVRMSSGKQERSPAQQRNEIKRLAKSEGCEIVSRFADEAITGDSGPEQRPGFREMLEAAERGEFQVLLLENGDRLGRFDSISGAEYYNRLRTAGIRIVTCSDGEIDLTTFEGRVVHTVRQEGRHAFLRDLSRKVVRGQASNAEAGNSNGGPPKYGMDRVLVDSAGQIVRRLAKGERSSMPGHRVRHVIGEDKARLDAIRYIFDRFANADIGCMLLASELDAKGYPAPGRMGWRASAVAKILANPIYCGKIRWGKDTTASYHTITADGIVSTTKPTNGSRRKPAEDAITADNGPGIITRKLFDLVQRKITKRSRTNTKRAVFPLSGLMVCEHCGQPMHGATIRRKNRQGKVTYAYEQYLCSTYSLFGRNGNRNQRCVRHSVKADLIMGWLVDKLRETYLGPGREALAADIRKEIRRTTKTTKGDHQRLKQRAGELDAEVGRLVKAVRTLDMPELVKELSDTRAEWDRVQAELLSQTHHRAPGDLESEAKRIVDRLWQLNERLKSTDPAALREVLQQMVSRIVCRWEDKVGKTGNIRRKLAAGRVELRPPDFTSCFSGNDAHAQTSDLR